MEQKRKQTKIFCPNCGSENEYSADYCFCCGNSLMEARVEIEDPEPQQKKTAENKLEETLVEKDKGTRIPLMLLITLIFICILLVFAVRGLVRMGQDVSSEEITAEESASVAETTTEEISSGMADIVSESAAAVSDTESESETKHYRITIASVDYSDYPEIRVYLNVQDEKGTLVSDIPASSIRVQSSGNILGLTSVNIDESGSCVLNLHASDSASANDLMTSQDLLISIDGTENESSIRILPGEEMMIQMMESFQNASIEDINAHTMNRMLDYIETNVDYNDHAALFNQMRTEITGGFLNTIAQSLQSCQVTDVFAEDENTLHVNVTLKVDGVYEEPYEVWQHESPAIASAITEFLGTVSNDSNIRLYSYVTEYCEYLVRKSADGSYKIYCYTGDISLAKNWQVYNAQVVS